MAWHWWDVALLFLHPAPPPACAPQRAPAKQTQRAAGTELSAKADKHWRNSCNGTKPSTPCLLVTQSSITWPHYSAVPSKKTKALPNSPHIVLELLLLFGLLFGLLHLPFVVYTHQKEMGLLSHTLGLEGKTSPLQRLIPRSCSNPCQSFWPSSAPSQEQPGSCTLPLSAAVLWKLAVKSNICILISNNHMFHLHCNFHLCSELFEAWTN